MAVYNDVPNKPVTTNTGMGANSALHSVDSQNFETIIGASMTFTGDITCSEPVCIHGTVKGSVRSTGYLYVSKTGAIEEGEVTANQLVLLGKVNTQKVEVGRLDVTSTGSVTSEVKVGKLTVEEGGAINGKISFDSSLNKSASAPAASTTNANNSSFKNFTADFNKKDNK